MNSLQTRLKAQGLALAIRTATGESPLVSDFSDYSELTFDPEQVKRLRVKLRGALDSAMKPGEPGDVRLDPTPIVLPVVLEKVLPVVLLSALAIYLLGRYRIPF